MEVAVRDVTQPSSLPLSTIAYMPPGLLHAYIIPSTYLTHRQSLSAYSPALSVGQLYSILNFYHNSFLHISPSYLLGQESLGITYNARIPRNFL